MSYYKTAWIYCDGPECDEFQEAASGMEFHTAYQARLWLKKQGWVNRGSKDYCPHCISALQRLDQ